MQREQVEGEVRQSKSREKVVGEGTVRSHNEKAQ